MNSEEMVEVSKVFRREARFSRMAEALNAVVALYTGALIIKDMFENNLQTSGDIILVTISSLSVVMAAANHSNANYSESVAAGLSIKAIAEASVPTESQIINS